MRRRRLEGCRGPAVWSSGVLWCRGGDVYLLAYLCTGLDLDVRRACACACVRYGRILRCAFSLLLRGVGILSM